MISTNLKRLTFFLVLTVVSLGVMTAYIKGKSETAATPTQAQPATPTNPNYPPQTQPEEFIGPPFKPNMLLNVKTQAGACPLKVGIWTFALPLEGGAEHTAVADFRPFAGNAKLVASRKNFVEYEARLDNYKSCIGSANSERPNVYSFQFRKGRVYFRVTLNKNNSMQYQITYQGVGAYRPYVRWFAGD